MGCTTSMTSMTDARAYEPGEVQATLHYQGNVHGNVVRGAIRGGKSAVQEINKEGDTPISEESYRNWIDTVLITGLFAPGFDPELMARVGVTDAIGEGMDVGLRTNFNVIKADAKVQIWSNDAQNQFASVSLGYTHHGDLVDEWLSYVTLTDFNRGDVDVQLRWGGEWRDIVKFSTGPHAILSRVSVEHKVPEWLHGRLPEKFQEGGEYDPNQLFSDEWIFYGGVTSTLMIGYKYAFVALDLGAFWMHFTPEVLGEERNYNGAAISGAAGLSFHYAF